MHYQKSLDLKVSINELIDVFKDEPYFFILESSLLDRERGRYSFIGFDPFKVFESKGQTAIHSLRVEFDEYRQTEQIQVSPLSAGIVGFFAYDMGLYQEKMPLMANDDLGLPDCLFGFYDRIITIDHFFKKIYISSSGLPEKNKLLKKKRAIERLDYILRKLSLKQKGQSLIKRNHGFEDKDFNDFPVKCNFTKDQYIRTVKKALDYIIIGDIYQVNLSQRFEFDFSDCPIEAAEIYKLLKVLSPTSFGCYFDAGGFQIISSSPERFLHLKNGLVHARPMKGTRARGSTLSEDARLREEIVHSIKEKAELLMITDLERNDLGKVCDYGSVKVADMRSIEEYKTVFQATSTIEGRLRKDKDPFDLINACFPSGSISGCPKIRSMEIIEELEPTRRSIYTGSLGYISFDGQLDFNILIRTLLAKDNKVYFQVGSGIVADSTPEGEYHETLIKAKAMQNCLNHVFQNRRNFQKAYA